MADESVARVAQRAGSNELWACPQCHGSLTRLTEESLTLYLDCAPCERRYPVCCVGDKSIPWLFADPIGAAADWQARYRGFLLQNQAEQNLLKTALYEAGLTVLNRERLERQLHARNLQCQQISEVLLPLGFTAEAELPVADFSHLGGSVDKNQGLLSYHDNLFRDWVWNNGENEAQFAAVAAGFAEQDSPQLGKLLALGAGAGRLVFDMQQKLRPQSTTLLDFNPLLLFAACHLFAGRPIDLYEFPVAPLNSRSHAVLQRCQRPEVQGEAEVDDVQFVLADATKAPFEDASFDTVLTPWLVDILPCGLADFIPQINRLLPVGGLWINTGSLAFAHSNKRWCYSEEEMFELVEQQGFRISYFKREPIPYLQSPHSAHSRTETVLSFHAIKVADKPVRPLPAYIPEWASRLKLPVPNTAQIDSSAASHLLVAQVLAAINGERSIDEIGELIANKYDLSKDSAVAAVRQILLGTL